MNATFDVEGSGAERVLFGSDWPHPEGLREPAAFMEDVASLRPDQQRRILSDNLLEPLGLV